MCARLGLRVADWAGRLSWLRGADGGMMGGAAVGALQVLQALPPAAPACQPAPPSRPPRPRPAPLPDPPSPSASLPLGPTAAPQLELMLPDIVDADITTLPVGNGVVVDVAPRPASPASRIMEQAGIAFFGSASAGSGGLEAAPSLAAGLGRGGGAGGGGYDSPAAPVAAAAAAVDVTPLGGSPLGSAPLGGSPLGSGASLAFAAGDGGGLAQRAAAAAHRERGGRPGMPRAGSHGHLAHLHPRLGAGQGGEAAAEEAEAQRRRERAEAAATAAAEHRDSKLAEKRSRRAALSSEDAEVSPGRLGGRGARAAWLAAPASGRGSGGLPQLPGLLRGPSLVPSAARGARRPCSGPAQPRLPHPSLPLTSPAPAHTTHLPARRTSSSRCRAACSA